MNEVRAHHCDKLILRSKVEAHSGEHEVAWKLLEEAHIFSQSYIALHMYVHWEMLRLAFKEQDSVEIIGQIIRFVLAGPASLFRLYPEGNTGRSDVGIFKKMDLPKRISEKMKELDRTEIERRKNDGKVKKYQRQHPISRR